MTRDDIVSLIDSRPWFHSFKLNGVTTPGLIHVDADAWVDEMFRGTDISGKRCLEIGTWDGPYAFALEAKGAIVEATDIQNPDATGFNVAKTILSSKVNYTQTSVYEVDRHFPEASFDHVLFLGVFYHLKYPVLALEALSRLLKRDGHLYFEGECLLNYAARVDNREPSWLERVMIRRLAGSGYPVSLYYSEKFKDDASNWHIPNVACLDEWMRTAGLTIQESRLHQAPKGIAKFGTQRVSGFAVKTAAIRLEHPLVEDIAADLEREKIARARRAGTLTFRRIVGRTLDQLLAPLGLQRRGSRIMRAGKR